MLRHLLRAIMLAACCAAQAAPVIDQTTSEPGFGSGSAVIRSFGYDSPSIYAQSFQPSRSSIMGAGIVLTASGDPFGVTISLYDALPNAGGVSLASGTTSGSVGWIDAFWSPVQINPGQTYFLVIAPDTADAGFFGFVSDGLEPLQAFGSRGEYAPIPDTIFAFRTYAQEPSSGEVPEPASLVLMALALAGLLIARPRPKR